MLRGLDGFVDAVGWPMAGRSVRVADVLVLASLACSRDGTAAGAVVLMPDTVVVLGCREGL